MGGPDFGNQRHADTEFAAEPHTGKGAIGQQIPIAPGNRTEAGKDREHQDREGQDANTAQTVAEMAEKDPAQYRANQRP